jgi:hypothetical protein
MEEPTFQQGFELPYCSQKLEVTGARSKTEKLGLPEDQKSIPL